MKLDEAKIKEPPKTLLKKTNNESSRKGLYSESHTGEYYKFTLDKLIPFQNQARIDFDEDSIIALSNTIKKHGIRQPLTIIPSPKEKDKYEIVSGERRFRAAKLVGLDRVPCIIISDYNKAEEIALIENIQREDLHPVELGEVFKNILNRGICHTAGELAEKISIPRTKIVEYISFSKLPDSVKLILVKNKIKTRDLLRELIKCSSAEAMIDKISINNKDNNKTERRTKPSSRSINSLFALTRKGHNLVFKANIFKKLGYKKQLEIIEEIEAILKAFRS
jgi:ParB family transcriptional regulator, chromosome partitioning protein